MGKRGSVRRSAIATAAVAFLLLPLSCTNDDPYDAAQPLLPTAAPTSTPDESGPESVEDRGTDEGAEADGATDDAAGDNSDDEAVADTSAAESDAAVEGSESSGDVTTGDVTEGGVPEASAAVESAPPTAAPAPASNNGASRPSAGATNVNSGGGTTLSGPDLIASQPPPPAPPTPPATPPPPDPDVPDAPPTAAEPPAPDVAPATPPSPDIPATCFGRTVDECTGEVVPEGAVTQMGEYQTNVPVPPGKAVDIYFDQARSVDEMSHLCGSMGGILRQRVPDGSRWSGWWFCDDVTP